MERSKGTLERIVNKVMRKEQPLPVAPEQQVFPGPAMESATTVSDKPVMRHDERLARNINHAHSGMVMIGQGPKIR
jgi:hypothetical protein